MDERTINAACATVNADVLLALNLFAASELNPEVRAGRYDVVAYIQRRAAGHRSRAKGVTVTGPVNGTVADADTTEESDTV
jgi:hypothetical protein